MKKNHDVTLGILRVLRDSPEREVSGECLRRLLGISRSAIWKQIERLRAQGYEIEARTRRGYRLIASPDTPLETEVAPLLTAKRMGRRLHFMARTDSTSLQLDRLAEEGVPEGTVVIADEQTAGRGRMARAWFSPPGVNLYFSLLLRPPVAPAAATTLPLLAGLAVSWAVERVVPTLAARIKWPNDIQIGGRKVCGILCDMQAEADSVRHVIMGLGVNVNLVAEEMPPDIARLATSLRIAGGCRVSRVALLAAILNLFEPAYERWRESGLDPFLEDLRARDALAGCYVTLEQFQHRLSGRAAGMAPNGALLLETDNGSILPVLSGDAHVATTHGP